MTAYDAMSSRMLIIDDDRDMAELVRKLGTRLGFHCECANNFDQFAAAYSTHVTIIVLDLFMPDVDGIEIIRFLAETRSKASIVLMSGNDRSILNAARKLAVELGLEVLGSIAKPFRLSDLSEILEKHSLVNADGMNGLQDAPTLEELKAAIERKELSLFYQPQINMSTGNAIGVEALCRWHHNGRWIYPDYFIPLAEENDLIRDLTEHVIELALSQIRTWMDTGYLITMSINISPAALHSVEFPETLMRQVKEKDLGPECLVLELTESTMSESSARTLDILTRLRMKGFKLSIDDFGTGFSSLKQLVRAPFTELKIDRSFVAGMREDKECLAIVRASIRLAHELNMKVVAEGIETTEISNSLNVLECDYGQGFLFSRPLAPKSCGEWLAVHYADGSSHPENAAEFGE